MNNFFFKILLFILLLIFFFKKGLAHFLEHSIFLGSKKFPNSSKFSEILSENSGNYNAFTEPEMTTFFYYLNSKAFEKSLEIFTSYFNEPIFDSNKIDKEIKAVNNEYENDLQNQEWRIQSIFKKISNKLNPYSRFDIGNTNSLKNNVKKQKLSIRNELKNFMDNYYSSHKMGLCVFSDKSLDVLEELVVKNFKNIRYKRDSKITDLNKIPKRFGKNELGKFVWVEPFSNEKQLIFNFILDDLVKNDSISNSINYIKYFIDKPDKFGFKYHLKYEKNWIFSIQSNLIENSENFKTLNIELNLTEEGQNHLVELIQAFFG